MKTVIRPALSSDVEAIIAWTIRVPLFQEHGMTAEKMRAPLLSQLNDPAHHIIVAEVEGIACGFANFVKKGGFARSGYLKLLSVDPDRKSKGIGRALMDSLEKDFLKPTGLILLCTHTNLAAQAFYENLGYTRVGELPNYLTTGLNELIYYKPG